MDANDVVKETVNVVKSIPFIKKVNSYVCDPTKPDNEFILIIDFVGIDNMFYKAEIKLVNITINK